MIRNHYQHPHAHIVASTCPSIERPLQPRAGHKLLTWAERENSLPSLAPRLQTNSFAVGPFLRTSKRSTNPRLHTSGYGDALYQRTPDPEQKGPREKFQLLTIKGSVVAQWPRREDQQGPLPIRPVPRRQKGGCFRGNHIVPTCSQEMGGLGYWILKEQRTTHKACLIWNLQVSPQGQSTLSVGPQVALLLEPWLRATTPSPSPSVSCLILSCKGLVGFQQRLALGAFGERGRGTERNGTPSIHPILTDHWWVNALD